MSDHLKMSNTNTAKCFSAVEMLATPYAAVAHMMDAWDHWYATPAEPDTVIPPRHRRLHLFLILSRWRLRRPWARHPVHPSVVVFFLTPSTHPTIACTIRTLVRIRGGRGGQRNTTNTPDHQEPTSWRGAAKKQKEPANPEWRAAPKGKEYPSEPTAPSTGVGENSSSLGNIDPLHEYDPSRADERWRALTPRVVKGHVTLIDLEDFYARWQRVLPFSNDTCRHVIRAQLLSKLAWIKEKVVKQEAKNSQGSYVVDFSGLDPSPGRAPFEKELKNCSTRRCTTVLDMFSYSGPGVIVDCKDPYLQELILQLNNTPQTRGYTMKVE